MSNAGSFQRIPNSLQLPGPQHRAGGTAPPGLARLLTASLRAVQLSEAESGASAQQSSTSCSFRKSKIGLGGFGQRHQPMIEEIAVVLVARDRQKRRVFDAAPALYRRPGR